MECKTCKEEIKDQAKKCNHCNSFQDYRRHLNLSTTILSLLVTLITVISFGLPYLIKALEDPNSEIEMHVVARNVMGNEIDIYFCNEGKRPGLLHNPKFEFNYHDKTYYLTLRRVFVKVDNMEILKKDPKEERNLYELYPAQTALIRYKLESIFPVNAKDHKDRFNKSENFDKKEIKNIVLTMITTTFKGENINYKIDTRYQPIDSMFLKILSNLPELPDKR